jgi:hypothetical protein
MKPTILLWEVIIWIGQKTKEYPKYPYYKGMVFLLLALWLKWLYNMI